MPFFRVKSEKIYTGQKKFTQVPLVVLVTNIRYERDSKVYRLRFTDYDCEYLNTPLQLFDPFKLMMIKKIMSLLLDTYKD